jgi:hypothetical protein
MKHNGINGAVHFELTETAYSGPFCRSPRSVWLDRTRPNGRDFVALLGDIPRSTDKQASM